MNNKYPVKVILPAFLLFLPVICAAQRIDNVHPEITGEKINIFYDLFGISQDQTVLVKVFMSTDGGATYGQHLRSVSGDVGIVTGPGDNRCITWDVFSDLDELVSVNVRFRVTADLLGSEKEELSTRRKLMIGLNTGIGSKGLLDSWSAGFGLKGTVRFKQLGLGFRGDIYKTFREDINYVSQLVTYPDTGFYWGYSGGAIIEYDLLKDNRYSLYPFLYIGQAKINYRYNPDYNTESYFKYTVFGTVGAGFNIRAASFLYFGVELEYLLSPWFDLVPTDDLDEGLDGFNVGFVIRFVLDTG